MLCAGACPYQCVVELFVALASQHCEHDLSVYSNPRAQFVTQTPISILSRIPEMIVRSCVETSLATQMKHRHQYSHSRFDTMIIPSLCFAATPRYWYGIAISTCLVVSTRRLEIIYMTYVEQEIVIRTQSAGSDSGRLHAHQSAAC